MAGDEFLQSIETNFRNAVSALNTAHADDKLGEDLAEKITFYQHNDHARRRIAEAGWQAIHQRHSAEKVAQYMLDCLMHGGPKQPYDWPTQSY